MGDWGMKKIICHGVVLQVSNEKDELVVTC